MRSLELVKVSQDDRYDTHEARRSSRVAGLLALPLVLVALFALCSAAPVLAAESIDGLAPGVTVPPWAVGKSIHFMPYHHRASLGTLQGAPQAVMPLTAKGTICKEEQHEKCVKHYAEPLHFYGGEVQIEPTVYLIFWGSEFAKGTLETALRTLYNSFMTLPGGNLAYQGILTQYHGHDHLENNQEGHIGSTILNGGIWNDNRESAPKTVTQGAVENEVHQAIATNSWPQNNPNAQFIVFTPQKATLSQEFLEAEACGNHGVTTEGNLVYAFVPYAGAPEFKGGCLVDEEGGDENAVHHTTETASHEYAEAATNPHPSAKVSEVHGWTDSENEEIGDICDWGDRELKTGSGVWVQELWGNHEKGCVLADPPEPLPPAPSVTTESATGITSFEATLTGSVNPNESESHDHFEYGTTTSYGSSTAEGDAGFGETAVPVSVKITGLKAGTLYHYRVVASSWVGTTDGVDQTFRTAGWTIQSTQNPHGSSETDEFRGVSCWSATGCDAVGLNSTAENGIVGLVERWNGASWEVQSTPKSEGAEEDNLESVSCRSASECEATGYAELAGNKHVTLAERWNGTAWSVQSTPSNKGEDSNLVSVSCASASECVASGFSLPTFGKKAALAELWNGKEWKILTTATLPKEDEKSWFESISCPSAKDCIAVGGVYNTVKGSVSLVESYNGSTWTLQSTPTLELSIGEQLSGVSCSAASACTAVGGYNNYAESGERALIERYNGTSWQLQESPSPVGKPAPKESRWELKAVSCPTSSSCVTVGSYAESRSGQTHLLGEEWNGSRWELELPVDRTGTKVLFDEPRAVSCSAALTCTMAGLTWKEYNQTETLAERMEP